MPRRKRKVSKSGIYHLIIRGVNRQTIFEDEEDKYRFLETLEKYKEVSEFQVFGYCFMDNHVHILLQEREETISHIVKRISSSYVYWYNRKYGRNGHLFQERFKSETVESAAYFLTVLRYIHQNPVKAKLTKNVFEYKWTSIHAYLQKDWLVDVNFGLSLFSTDRKRAIKLFIAYMQQPNNDECLDDVLRVRLGDSEVREYLTKLGVPNSAMLQQMEKGERNKILAKLKKIEGISIRQLARITGISKSVIHRAGT